MDTHTRAEEEVTVPPHENYVTCCKFITQWSMIHTLEYNTRDYDTHLLVDTISDYYFWLCAGVARKAVLIMVPV